jgi:hypothetical protein
MSRSPVRILSNVFPYVCPQFTPPIRVHMAVINFHDYDGDDDDDKLDYMS